MSFQHSEYPPNFAYSVYDYTFRTAEPRIINDELFINERAKGRNDEFDIKFFLPKLHSSNKKQKHLIIILNGFGEWNRRIYHGSQGICKELASIHGISSVLLPLPFHFNRFNRKDYNIDDWPKNLIVMAIRRPMRFWDGYTQELADIGKLVRLIRTQQDEFYSQNFDINTRIYLLGYSMGGLGVLAYQLSASKAKGSKCDGIILLASGCHLKTLVPAEFREVPEEDWRKFVNYFTHDDFLREVKIDIDSIHYRVFKKVVAGQHDEELHERLSDQVNDVIVILGGEDDTNKYQWVIAVTDTGTDIRASGEVIETIPLFHTVIIPHLHHSLEDNSWKRNQNYVLNIISNFMLNRGLFEI